MINVLLADEAGYTFLEGSVLGRDTVFQGLHLDGVVILQTKKKLRGRELTDEEKVENRAVSRIRIKAEHEIDGFKR